MITYIKKTKLFLHILKFANRKITYTAGDGDEGSISGGSSTVLELSTTIIISYLLKVLLLTSMGSDSALFFCMSDDIPYPMMIGREIIHKPTNITLSILE